MDLPGNSTFQVLVDSEAAKNNITRLADKMKWQVSAERNGEEYLLTLIKK
jgi:TusA-related sulfurtransferase